MTPEEEEGEAGYAALAASETAREAAEHRHILRRQRITDEKDCPLGSITQRPVTITYDPTAGAAYIYLVPPGEAHAAHTGQLSPGVLADYDTGGRLIGVELLSVTCPVIEHL